MQKKLHNKLFYVYLRYESMFIHIHIILNIQLQIDIECIVICALNRLITDYESYKKYKHMSIIKMPEYIFSGTILSGESVEHLTRTLNDIKFIFEHPEFVTSENSNQTAYTVSSYKPVSDGSEGGLFFGVTNIYPGMVGDEYIMTKGHYHSKIDTAEFYWGVEGEGVLILMDKSRNIWAERVFPGSLHYIAAGVAHRMANTGDAVFSFGACWGSDAGHDYGTIETQGFAARLKQVDGEPKLIK